MPFTLAPYETRQYFDDNGDPLSGGFVFTYASGTMTPAVTYLDAIGTPNTNPIVMDAAGRCVIYLDALSYKFIIEDANNVPISSTDPIQSIGLAGSGGGVGSVLFPLFGDSTSPITNTVYAPGTTVDTTHAGTSLFTIDSALIPAGSYAVRAMILGSGGANTVSVSLMDLDSGAPNTPLATASGSSATGTQVTSAAITFAPSGVNRRYGIKTIVSAGSGFAWGIELIRIA